MLSFQGHLIRKSYQSWQIFEESGILCLRMLSFKRLRFCSMFASHHKEVFRKLVGRRPWLGPFWRIENLLKMLFVTNVSLKMFSKISKNVDLLHCWTNQSQNFLKIETKKQTNFPRNSSLLITLFFYLEKMFSSIFLAKHVAYSKSIYKRL